VAQILSFSRPGKAEKRTLQISHIIQEALKLLRPSLPSTIDIKRQIKVKSDSVLADPSHIHQIIMNLCTNAAHAMRAQGGALTVALGELEVYPDDVPIHPKLGPGSYLDLSVSDTGHGIHPDIMDRIFDPFFTTKIPEEGTGIGLAVVYGIVNNMGGVITVHSEPGSGTNFHVYLPKSSSEPIAESRREDAIPTGTERILLVDDEADIADMDRQILQRLGYSVVSTTSSPEALKIFKDQPHQFDLVITDQTMPKMTGIDLSREIKRIRSDVPIILFSGLANIAEEKMKDNGISRYLTKPMSLPQLACAVREALDEYGKKGE
jgi:CheY-like chemotaxis protein